MWLIERIFIQLILMVRLVGYHDAVDSWDVRGEISGTFPRASLVNTGLADMSLDIVEFFIVTRIVMWNWDGLRHCELG